MKNLIRILLSCLFLAPGFALAADPIALFDGKSLDDWTPRAGMKEEVKVVDGEIHILTKANMWLTHPGIYTNFVLEVEAFVPTEAGVNGGIAFRCQNKTGKPKGYQCEVEPSSRAYSGGIYGIGAGGWLYPKKGDDVKAFQAKSRAAFKKDAWNVFKIRCNGDRIRTWINGQPIANLTDSKFASGYIGVQHHGKGGTYKYRNIRITVLE